MSSVKGLKQVISQVKIKFINIEPFKIINMSQAGDFNLPQTDQIWKQKCLKLENELLQARIQQINLKRINRSLEQTLKLAMTDDLPQTQPNSTQRINLSWKDKYEQQLEKNIQNLNYIKLLQNKRNTSSSKMNKKRQHQTSTRLTLNTQYPTRYTPTPLTTMNLSQKMNTRQEGRKSVRKMEGFMERLMKDKYPISEFVFDDYVQNYPIEVEKIQQFKSYNDPIEKLFGQVTGVRGKENWQCETEEQELPLRVRPASNQNRMPTRLMSSKLVEHTIKLSKPSHIR